MQNVCNTNNRILIQQSEKFIFLGILVLGLQCTRPLTTPVECGPTSYHLDLQRRKQFTQVTRQQTELDINLAPDYCLGWFTVYIFFCI